MCVTREPSPGCISRLHEAAVGTVFPLGLVTRRGSANGTSLGHLALRNYTKKRCRLLADAAQKFGGRCPLAMANARMNAFLCSIARLHAWTQSSSRSASRNSSKAYSVAARCWALATSGGCGHSRSAAAPRATRARATSTDDAASARLPVSLTESPAAPASSDICSIAAYSSSNTGRVSSAQLPVEFVMHRSIGNRYDSSGEPGEAQRAPSRKFR